MRSPGPERKRATTTKEGLGRRGSSTRQIFPGGVRSVPELSRSALVALRPFGEPAQFREPARELGTSADHVHRTYLDSGAEERPRGAPARHSLENSCSMSRAPSRPHSTPMCGGTMGEQQIQFGTHLLRLRVGNAAEAYVPPTARTRTEVPRARETTAAEAGHVHQWLPPATGGRPGGRLIWSLGSTLISVRPGSALASGVHDLPIASADQSVIRGGERPIVSGC
jgi:hypothetical protein